MQIRELYELKISYLKYRLKNLPSGNLTMHRDKHIIRLHYDPANPKISSHNPRRIVCDSKEGKIYLPLIKEADKLINQLRSLQATWNSTFKIPPREIEYPLKRKTSSYLNKDLYFASSPQQNALPNAKELVLNDQSFRSKNELLVCSALESLGYNSKTEIMLKPDGFTTLYPDATFYIPEIEKPVAVEVDGAMDKETYYQKSETRKYNYYKCGLVEFRDVIFFRISDANSVDIDRLKALITASIFVNINDFIFPD